MVCTLCTERCWMFGKTEFLKGKQRRMRQITSHYYEENYQNLVLRKPLLRQVYWETNYRCGFPVLVTERQRTPSLQRLFFPLTFVYEIYSRKCMEFLFSSGKFIFYLDWLLETVPCSLRVIIMKLQNERWTCHSRFASNT